MTKTEKIIKQTATVIVGIYGSAIDKKIIHDDIKEISQLIKDAYDDIYYETIR